MLSFDGHWFFLSRCGDKTRADEPCIYLCGNSLGMRQRLAEAKKGRGRGKKIKKSKKSNVPLFFLRVATQADSAAGERGARQVGSPVGATPHPCMHSLTIPCRCSGVHGHHDDSARPWVSIDECVVGLSAKERERKRN